MISPEIRFGTTALPEPDGEGGHYCVNCGLPAKPDGSGHDAPGVPGGTDPSCDTAWNH